MISLSSLYHDWYKYRNKGFEEDPDISSKDIATLNIVCVLGSEKTGIQKREQNIGQI